MNMKNLLPTPMNSCISFVSNPPAADHRPCFLFFSSKTLERCFPAFVGIAGWRDLWEGGKGWMGSGKGMCLSSRMPGHKALPPSSDPGFTSGSGRAAGPRRSWGCSAGDPDPPCLLCLGQAEGPTLLGRMKKLLSKHEVESFAVLFFECCNAQG